MTSFALDLVERVIENVVLHDADTILLLGFTPATLEVQRALVESGLRETILGVVDPSLLEGRVGQVRPWSDVQGLETDLLVVCADAEKQELLRAYMKAAASRPLLPRVVVGGTAHLAFRDEIYSELDAPALVPSYATGYEFTRVHIYQCLAAAAANGLKGAIVEFGAFKGGTTAWLARTARRLGLASKVIGFDSWTGFPPRRSLLDMYEHPRCVFRDVEAVRSYLEPLGVELVVGDITETAHARLDHEPILLAFVDTDNYSPAAAALRVVVPRLVVGGAIVFDHYATTGEYVETIGERIAADEVLRPSGLLNIHGSGVFVKLAAPSSATSAPASAVADTRYV